MFQKFIFKFFKIIIFNYFIKLLYFECHILGFGDSPLPAQICQNDLCYWVLE